jgi:hypothetical protein
MSVGGGRSEVEARLHNVLVQIAHEQSGADGVIAVFIKGPSASVAHSALPEMLGFVPAILDAASRDTYEYIKRLAEDIDRDATGELRKQ